MPRFTPKHRVALLLALRGAPAAWVVAKCSGKEVVITAGAKKNQQEELPYKTMTAALSAHRSARVHMRCRLPAMFDLGNFTPLWTVRETRERAACIRLVVPVAAALPRRVFVF